jgi:hypothetical protein
VITVHGQARVTWSNAPGRVHGDHGDGTHAKIAVIMMLSPPEGAIMTRRS